MPPVEITSNPPINRIVAGHFREKIGYGIVRPKGRDDWLLIYTVAGKGDLLDPAAPDKPARRIAAQPGDAVLWRPGVLQDYRVDRVAKRWEILWAHFHPNPDWQAWLDWPGAGSDASGLMRISVARRGERQSVERALHKLNDLAVGSHRLSKSLAMNALEEALLLCAKNVRHQSEHDPRVAMAQDYLCKHLSDQIRLADVADAAGLSVSRLSHLFKLHTGVTPQQYFETQRIERARQLLEFTSLSIKVIAAEVGFASPFYFTNRFKRHTGKNPRTYRRHKHCEW